MKITELIDSIAIVSPRGYMLVRDLIDSEILSIRNKVIWKAIYPSGYEYVKFGDNSWTPQKVKDHRLTFNIINPKIDFELKASILLLLECGEVEGGSPLKWSTVLGKVSYLSRLARYLSGKEVDSFRSLESFSDMKLRNYAFGFFHAPIDLNGFGISSTTIPFRKMLDTLVSQGLISDHVKDIFMEEKDKRDSEVNHKSLSYPVIPTNVAKKLISESSKAINDAEKILPKFEEVNDRYIIAISELKTTALSNQDNIGNVIAMMWGKRKNNWTEQFKPMLEVLENLRRHVLVQVLLFTGMRKEEALALENNCALYNVKSGKNYYSVRSILTKTDESSVYLDWVANKDLYRAINILVRLNDCFKKRASMLLTKRRHNLRDVHILKLEWGLRQNNLFSFAVSSTSVSFNYVVDMKNTMLSLSKYKILLDENDIAQLDKLGCNFISTGGNNRGVPYKVGDTFYFTPHKFRHTFAWFIVANRLGDLDDIKYQFKHLTEAMTLIYTKRALDSLEELSAIIDAFEETCNNDLINELVELGNSGQLSGGGGERIVKNLSNMAIDFTEITNELTEITPLRQAHFESIEEYIFFLKKNFGSMRGLPHGLCTKGAGCKIKNAPDPSGCVYCENYVVSRRHLPHWRFVQSELKMRLDNAQQLPQHEQKFYDALIVSWTDNLNVANQVLFDIEKLPEEKLA
ncbi:hypothetical protein [Aliivibrio fischeri]|uniref:Tyr recombinase domain-containing protein n=1 Tax=Aliivibrio fischeri TaxID=668 RepID=A0A844P5V1_ALIFS|nr:hypothetical protein [Aliivibrio fischeri]MUK50771.1 hypothetical protein [Aliivibrio fischeri]